MQSPNHPIINYLMPFLADLHLSITFFRSHWVLSDTKRILLKSKDVAEIYQVVTHIARKQSVFFPSFDYVTIASATSTS